MVVSPNTYKPIVIATRKVWGPTVYKCIHCSMRATYLFTSYFKKRKVTRIFGQHTHVVFFSGTKIQLKVKCIFNHYTH